MGDTATIEGVKVVPLRQIVDERGKIMHMLKATDEHFIEFGEIYFSCAWPGVVKAWHIHQTMTVKGAKIASPRMKRDSHQPGTSATSGKVQMRYHGHRWLIAANETAAITAIDVRMSCSVSGRCQYTTH